MVQRHKEENKHISRMGDIGLIIFLRHHTNKQELPREAKEGMSGVTKVKEWSETVKQTKKGTYCKRNHQVRGYTGGVEWEIIPANIKAHDAALKIGTLQLENKKCIFSKRMSRKQ